MNCNKIFFFFALLLLFEGLLAQSTTTTDPATISNSRQKLRDQFTKYCNADSLSRILINEAD